MILVALFARQTTPSAPDTALSPALKEPTCLISNAYHALSTVSPAPASLPALDASMELSLQCSSIQGLATLHARSRRSLTVQPVLLVCKLA